MATNTAASFTSHTGNGGAGPFSISFSYQSEDEIDVTVAGVLKTKDTTLFHPLLPFPLLQGIILLVVQQLSSKEIQI